MTSWLSKYVLKWPWNLSLSAKAWKIGQKKSLQQPNSPTARQPNSPTAPWMSYDKSLVDAVLIHDMPQWNALERCTDSAPPIPNLHHRFGDNQTMIDTYITLHYITLHYIALHYIALHYIALHCIALHYITLHYIHTSIYIYIHVSSYIYIHPYIHYKHGNGKLFSHSISLSRLAMIDNCYYCSSCGYLNRGQTNRSQSTTQKGLTWGNISGKLASFHTKI